MQKSFSISQIMPLYIVIFFGFLGYSMMITLFTPMFMYAQGGIISPDSSTEYRIFMLGIILAIFPLAQFFSSPILGTLSDHFGRKPILLITMCFAPICYGLIAISLIIPSISLLMVSLLIAGISQANIVIAQSAIADVASSNERGRLFGYIYLSSSLAFVVGPLLGGKLVEWTIFPWLPEATPFFAVFILLLITLFWIEIEFKETKQNKESHISFMHAFTNLLGIFNSPRLRILYLVNFLLYFSIFGFFRCYPMYVVDKYHVEVSKLSEYIAWVAVPIILVNLGLTGPLFKRFSPLTLTLWSSFLTGIFMLFIIVPTSQNALWITLFLTGAALALALPSSATLLSLSTSSNVQGRVMGNNQSLQVAAEALSAFIAGLLASISVDMSLVILALIACATSVLILLMQTRIKENMQVEA